MRPSEIKEYFRALAKQGVEGRLPPGYVWGPPGIGKSRIIADIAQEMKIGFVDVRLLLCDPSDLKGIPFPDVQNKTALWFPPSTLPVTMNGKRPDLPEKGILFFDDMATAPPLLQAAAYQISTPPYALGDAKLLRGWAVAAAGNRREDRSLTHRMPPALANRFTHLELEPNLPDWTNWAVSHDISPTIITFLNNMGDDAGGISMLFAFNPEKEERAFPSPRAWEGVDGILKAGLSENVEGMAIEGTVGLAASAKFGVFRRLFNKLPDPMDILIRKRYSVTPKQIDSQFAFVGMVVSKADKTHLDSIFGWASALPEEMGVLLGKLTHGKFRDACALSPAFIKWASEHADVMIDQ